MGLSLRLDPVLGDPDRNDRRGRCGLCAFPGYSRTWSLAQYLDRPAHQRFFGLRGQPDFTTARRDPLDSGSDGVQHARLAMGQGDPKCVHLGQDSFAPRACSHRNRARTEPGGHNEQLQRPLDTPAGADRKTGPSLPAGRCRNIRRAGPLCSILCGAGRIAVFGGCLEQHHLHRRGGEGASAQHPALAVFRHGSCH